MNILLIEDEPETAAYIVAGLAEAGHHLDHAEDGADGAARALNGAYDLLIVDRMLPSLDGVSAVRRLRGQGLRTPVLFLSTLDGVDDRVSGLDAGGDDYLTKPFAIVELKARVAALGRRPALSAVETVLRVGDLEMNLVERTVRRGEVGIDLLPREWQLLEYLIRNANRAVTRSMLLEAVWNFHFDPRTNVVETHISRLRQKIDKGFDAELIQTVRNVGYRISAADHAA
ncbi:transcriptional activator protein CopR [mine drainage metagenome]|uniref:Transcriptional activator protein CopR n=1 Tax=mine drainage metagenome TaxID=410659 RepID=A0A1J5RQZ0_9ZZZZ